MLVRQVMSKKVLTITPDFTFQKIVKFLSKHNVSGVPVVNKKKRVIGVISEKDLFHKLFPKQKTFYKDAEYYMNYDRMERDAPAVLKIPARKIMSKKVIHVAPDDHVLKACSLFMVHGIRRLPVIDKGRLVGIVTTGSIYRNFLMHITEGGIVL